MIPARIGLSHTIQRLWPQRSFRARVTLWYVAFVAVLLVALALSVYFIVRNTLNESLNESLDQRLADARTSLRIADGQPALDQDGPPRADDDSFTRLIAPNGAILDSSTTIGARLPIDVPRLARAIDGRSSHYDLPSGDEPYRVVIIPIREGDRVIGALETGVSRSDTDEALDTLLLVLVLAVPATILVAGGGGGDDDQPITGSAYDDAVAAALAHTGGGTVTETELGDGGAACEVEIRLDDGREVEVELDADFNVIGSADDDDGPGGEDDDDEHADDGAGDDD